MWAKKKQSLKKSPSEIRSKLQEFCNNISKVLLSQILLQLSIKMSIFITAALLASAATVSAFAPMRSPMVKFSLNAEEQVSLLFYTTIYLPPPTISLVFVIQTQNFF
jgi:hypothetical protein